MVQEGHPEAPKEVGQTGASLVLTDAPTDALIRGTRLRTVPEIEDTHFRSRSEATFIFKM